MTLNARSLRRPPAPAAFKKRQREAATTVFVEAAEAIIAEKGYDGATMQDIARAAGCAAGTLYLYFRNKEELFNAMVAKHSHAISALVQEELDRRGDALLRMRQALAVVVTYFNQHRAFFRIFYTAGPGGRACVQSNLRDSALRNYLDVKERQVEVVRAGQKAGQIRKDLPADELVEFLHGVNVTTFARWATAGDVPAPARQLELLWQFGLGGLTEEGTKR